MSSFVLGLVTWIDRFQTPSLAVEMSRGEKEAEARRKEGRRGQRRRRRKVMERKAARRRERERRAAKEG